MEKSEIEKTIRTFVLERFCQDINESEIKNDTLLLSHGIIDSISTMQIVSFIENEFKFEFKAYEVDKDNLDSISIMADFVQKKING
jgi:acyl carrier protein